MDELDRLERELADQSARCWELTAPLLGAFTPTALDNDAYTTAFVKAAEELGIQVMMRGWALMLWPTAPSCMDAAAAAEYLLAPPDKPWLIPSGALLDASATYAMNPTPDNFSDVLGVIKDALYPACSPQSQLWQCGFHWAQQLYVVTEQAGGFELYTGLTDLHAQWAAGQDSMTLAPALALVVGCVAAGNHDAASTYLSRIIAKGTDLQQVVSTWLIGLSKLVPPAAWDQFVVAEADGTPLSIGSLDGIDDDELRGLAVLTRDLVDAVHRGDQAAADVVRPRVSTSKEAAYHWAWLLARMLGARVTQLNARIVGAS